MAKTFTERDEYQRKSIAIKLEQLLNTSLDISPIVIDGSWGTGKTEFSVKLQNYLLEKNEERIVVYIDAFKEDHCEDPLLSITAAIANVLPALEKDELIKKAIPAIKFGVKTALKAGAGWVLRQETDKLADDFQEAIKTASNAAIDGTIENLISEHMEAELNIKALNDKLKELAASKKIIIIIDELDRCRPTFAVDMLEKIKHIFDAPNVKFILVANLSQLKAAINHVYGSSVDSQNYLDKFIKFTIRLPNTFRPDGYESYHTSLSHWNNIVHNNDLTQPINYELSERIIEILCIRPLSLREVETLHRYVEIYQTVTEMSIGKGKLYVYNLVTFIGIYLYCFSNNRILDDISSQSSLKEIAAMLGITKIKVDLQNPYDIPHHHLVFFGLIKDREKEFVNYLPTTKEELEVLRDITQSLTKNDFRGFNYAANIISTFEKLSLFK
ncbi:P-loop NTPase fold protein [Buttiauxella gaviniae]|uniref:P-loop NTPase fold protein n=1 Tax=Buttiauxella gaviniae TaxID=82990 RepID=UPI0039771E37